MKEIFLSNGMKCLVSECDYDDLIAYSWHFHGAYAYRHSRDNGIDKVVLMHRHIMKPSVGMTIDHVNMNKLDNRRENLRICTHAQNCHNKPARQSNISTGYKNVARTRFNRFNVMLTYNKKVYYSGQFRSLRDAVSAANKLGKEVVGEFYKEDTFNDSDEIILPLRFNKLSGTTSKYRGVSFSAQAKKFKAYITHNRTVYHLGYFKSEEEAALKYNEKAVELGIDHYLLNEIT